MSARFAVHDAQGDGYGLFRTQVEAEAEAELLGGVAAGFVVVEVVA